MRWRGRAGATSTPSFHGYDPQPITWIWWRVYVEIFSYWVKLNLYKWGELSDCSAPNPAWPIPHAQTFCSVFKHLCLHQNMWIMVKNMSNKWLNRSNACKWVFCVALYCHLSVFSQHCICYSNCYVSASTDTQPHVNSCVNLDMLTLLDGLPLFFYDSSKWPPLFTEHPFKFY